MIEKLNNKSTHPSIRTTVTMDTGLNLFLAVLASTLVVANSQEDLPTVYEYYRENDNQTGLTTNVDGFRLNGKPIRISSGSIHYFRVHPAYWRDRLRRLRAAGLNAVDTYVPWNLHEPEIGLYDFGNLTRDFSPFLDIRKFLQIAQEEDLLVILRPGPYICAEFEFGGLPSWLLRDPDMKVRSNYPGYQARVEAYFGKLLPLVTDLQWKSGGSIIAVQIENEFGGFGSEEKEHLEWIKELLERAGIDELLFTSDSPRSAGDKGAIPGVLQTANFRFTPKAQLDALLELQPDKPIYVAEFWSGWFDYWMHPFHTHVTGTEFRNNLRTILETYNGSVNFYMFHGGTNFGFLNGANQFPLIFPYVRHHTASYDYDAPLSESGRYMEKYQIIQDLMAEFSVVSLRKTEVPAENPRTSYGTVGVEQYLPFADLVNQVPSGLRSKFIQPVSMEELPINGGSGQSFGFVMYRKTGLILRNNTKLNIGRVWDELTVLVDGQRLNENVAFSVAGLANFGHWTVANQTFTLNFPSDDDEDREKTFDLLVENWGRVNFGGPEAFHQQKGIFNQTVLMNQTKVEDWEIIPLEFKGEWLGGLTGFIPVEQLGTTLPGPILVQSFFQIAGEPQDTFLDMSSWGKGNVFINGFNIGRYFRAGPTKTMYVAAPFLHTGNNTVTIFEIYQTAEEIVFSDTENLGPPSPI